jgi:hypothetical protein
MTEISIATDRKEQVMLFIIMAASFTYNLIKLVLGPSFSKVGGNYHLDLKIIWSSGILIFINTCIVCLVTLKIGKQIILKSGICFLLLFLTF